jgi:hypothetical protein
MTVVLIRGTSGSGKTWIAEKVIEACGGLDKAYHLPLDNPAKEKDKWRVGAYVWKVPPVTLMGRYTAACGGCDSINWKGAADDVEQVMSWQVASGQHVLFEGLTAGSYGVERLKRIPGLVVISLTTPLQECIVSIQQRRDARGVDKPLDTTNTRLKYNSVITADKNQAKAGVHVERLARPEAHARVMELLGL